MAPNKTQQTSAKVSEFIRQVEPEKRRKDAQVLLEVFAKATGFQPRMWGASIVGYGEYHYVYESGREGDGPATGFSPRKAKTSVYIMPGYTDFSDILSRLGKHGKGKSCLYINKLDDINLDVLGELIQAGLKDLDAKWPVKPT